MTLYDLLRQETSGSRRQILLVAGLSGLANAAMLAIINAAIQGQSSDARSLRQLVMFLLAFSLYVICFRRTFHYVTTVLEEILSRLRVRIAGKIRQADLLGLERVEQTEIFNLLTGEARSISESASSLAAALQSAILLVFASLYLALLSMPAFLFCVVALGAGIPTYLRRLREVSAMVQRTSEQEVACFNTIRDLLDGFKEVKLNQARGRSLMADIVDSAQTLRTMRIETSDAFNIRYIVAYGAFYVMIAAVAFLLPRLVSLPGPDMVGVLMTVLFIVGPLGTVIAGLQVLSRCNVTIDNMTRLEARLDHVVQTAPVPVDDAPRPPTFREIALRGVTFEYQDPEGSEVFRVGPLELSVKEGEIVFLMGGNGSGKTTLLKLLTALYPPSGGALTVDGRAMGDADLPAYRALFAAVFSDFHLFRRLYGLEEVPAATVQELLVRFHLDRKTAFSGGRFANLDLSTGQKKRLAMIVALLEDRPVYVFDEWAADQDPEARRSFYQRLLPELSSRGKTIVAVTHDERYVGVADRVVHMELGRIDRVSERGEPR